MLLLVISVFFLSVSAFSPTGGGACYNIDGTKDAPSSACYFLSSVGASMCCWSGEECRPDGLCTGSPDGPVAAYDNAVSIWRRSCTDFTWQDPACVAIAPSEYLSSLLSRFAQLIDNTADTSLLP